MSWNTLVGMKLPGGWDIVSLQPKLAGGTGGNFSVQFVVQKSGQTAFMKAFDLDKLFRRTAGDPRIMQRELESINFEITLLELCQKANARGVVVPIEIGKVTVVGVNADQPIQYIIFELGQQDVRKYHSYRAAVDYITNFAILKHAASGLLELHSLEIAHQDLKPSNVVIFPGNVSRLADLGRSSHKPIPVWHDKLSFAGDPTYQPIELLYGEISPDWHVRRISSDLYMLGSFAMFLFTSVNLTSQIFVRLPAGFHPAKWSDSYSEVTPYLRDALRKAMGVHPCFQTRVGIDLEKVIRELCDPDPEKRGSPKIGLLPYRYSLRRYVSVFDRMLIEVRSRGGIP